MSRRGKNEFIRSSEHSLRFCSRQKWLKVRKFLIEYRRLLQVIIDDLWNGGLSDHAFDPKTSRLECPRRLPNNYLKTFTSWFTARMKQCCGSQASAMVRGATAKRKKQYYVLAQLQRAGEPTEHLQRYIDLHPLTKPSARRAKAELDPRFIDFQEGREFDLFVRVRTIGDGLEFNLPLRHTKVSRKWLHRGTLKTSIRIAPKAIYLIYSVSVRPKKKRGRVLGADQGYLTALTLSDGQVTTPDRDGHDLRSIQARLDRRQKGSKGFQRAQQHRHCYVGWALNQLSWKYVREVRLEKIRNLRRGKRQYNKTLIHWAYPLIRQKCERLSETEGFVLREVSNAFRSQRCWSCGWVHKANRKGKTFRCTACGHTADADRNAASNLRLDLPEVPSWVRRRRLNRCGFYWLPDGLFDAGHEPVVRDTLKRASG